MQRIRPRKRLAIAAAATAVALAAALLAATAIAGYGPQLKPGLKSRTALIVSSATINGSDNPERYEVFCPRGLRPLGGGMLTDSQPDAAGGAFPVSSERLGQQDAWHTTVAQVGRKGGTPVTIQALCQRYSGNIDPVQHFIKSQTYRNVDPGETKQFTEKCPRGKRIISGGYLTSQLFTGNGVYVTESRMASQRSWTVSATGVVGGNGGQVSPIAYCRRSKKPLVTEVQSAPATATPAAAATAAAPDCPGSKHLITGGYSAPPTVRIFEGGFRGPDTWVASAAAYTGAGDVIAFGYCL
ncbi:MAG: hypothetical protein ACXWES_02760 [Solirubrobacterales bacterium]